MLNDQKVNKNHSKKNLFNILEDVYKTFLHTDTYNFYPYY